MTKKFDDYQLIEKINGIDSKEVAYSFLSGDSIIDEVRLDAELNNILIKYHFNGAHGSSKFILKTVEYNKFHAETLR